MFGAIRALELGSSILHLYSLSMAVAYLAANDPLGALRVTIVGCFCISLLAVVILVTEVARFKLRQYLRKRELAESQSARQQLEDSAP